MLVEARRMMGKHWKKDGVKDGKTLHKLTNNPVFCKTMETFKTKLYVTKNLVKMRVIVKLH